jgi:hypothetical protein
MTKLQLMDLFVGVRTLVTVLQMEEGSCKNTLLKTLGDRRYRFRMPVHELVWIFETIVNNLT